MWPIVSQGIAPSLAIPDDMNDAAFNSTVIDTPNVVGWGTVS